MIRSIKRPIVKRDVPIPVSKPKPWSGAAASLVMHGMAVVVFVTAQHFQNQPSLLRPRPSQQVDMVYLPPPPNRSQRRVDQPISRPPPDAVQAQRDEIARIRERMPDLPPNIQPSVPEPQPEPEPEPEEEKPDETAMTPPPPKEEPEQPTMESEARRIFGRPRLQAQQDDPTQMGSRLGTLADNDSPATRSCVPKPRSTSSQIEMAELIGRVWFDEAHTRPLAGAFLQMIGTPYSTYSDNTGRYRLVFDASLEIGRAHV